MTTPDLVIKEGVESYWRFHWAEKDSTRSLCGRHVMHSGVRGWGTQCGNESIEYRWCTDCARLREQRSGG